MLDHLIFGVPVLEDGVRQLERRFGVRAQPGGRHQGLGTHNAVFGLARSASTSTGAPPSIRPDQPHPG
jgi:Glyoxalase-like domain